MSKVRARPELIDLPVYVGGESRIPGFDKVVKLASNESALGPSPAAVAAVRDAAAKMEIYPDGAATALRHTLAEHHGLDAERIVCGAGSDEVIANICRAFAGPGEEVLHTEHGFSMYPIFSRAAGAKPVAAPETGLTADVDALLAHVTDRTRIVFLANPNNPTGTYLGRKELVRLRDGLPDHVLLALDAAYAEYIDAIDYTPGADLVDAGANVVMTRTFSKIYGLGGLRLGWAYAPPAIADILNRMRCPFNVSSLAQTTGIAAVGDQEWVERARRHTITWREWTADQLRALGLGVNQSHGNFLLVRFPETNAHNAEAADAFLKSRGMIARRMGGYGLGHSLRISIGLEQDMRSLVDILKEFLA
jgi:histidinol-phosphate aminotransferase